MYEEAAAWQRFMQTGMIADYLQYRAWHTHTPAAVQEGLRHADEYRRAGDPRTEYR